MVLGDAIVERRGGGESGDSPLLRSCPLPTTVEKLARAAADDAALRRAHPGPEAVLLHLLELDAAGSIRLMPSPVGSDLQSYYETGRTGGDRSLAYVSTYERNWREHRRLYDFAEARDANGARKAFQRDVYLHHLEPRLERLRPGAAVLDAGCGVGRLTGALLAHRVALTCLDASGEALKCAVRVALHQGARAEALDAVLCDVRDLSCFPDGRFAATLALELVCYQDDPRASLRELARVTAPGGLLALSVEGLHGSVLADPKIGENRVSAVLDTGGLDLDNEISVRYFTRAGLQSLCEQAGLESVEVVGTHYTADGVLDRLVTDEALADEKGRRRLATLERSAAADPALEPLARAWLAVSRVPGPPPEGLR